MRWASEEVPHVAYAAFAAATAASTSSTEASATCVVTAPVAGSVTGPYWPDVPSTVLPPIQWLTVFVMTYSFRLLAAQAGSSGFERVQAGFTDGGVGRRPAGRTPPGP